MGYTYIHMHQLSPALVGKKERKKDISTSTQANMAREKER
jgi:hypothetical protein